ncbi:MAG: TonB-dependent receptor [Sphingomonadaceae bacterium]|nr:TonB-dependent receptor [Sphingomonadaceae bacterium]
MKKPPEFRTLPLAHRLLTAIPFALLLPASTLADTGSERDIKVVARLDDPAQDIAGTTRSLQQRDIAAQAPASLLESLALLPGVDAFEKGGIGGGSYLSIRGGEPNFALVVINGVRVNDPMLSSGGGFDFSLIGPGDAARVDILSGPWSTSYGADALSGVVSIRLGTAQDGSGAAARMGTGSGGRFHVGGRAFLRGKAGALTLAASARDTNDYHAGSSSEGQLAMFAASPELGSAIGLDLFGFYSASQSEGFPEDSGGPELAVLRDSEMRDRRQIALGASASTAISSHMEAQLRASWGQSTFQSSSPGIAPGVLDGVPPISSDSRFDRLELVSSLSWSPAESFAASIGASFVHEDGQSDGVVDFGFPIPASYALSRSLPGLFATASLALPAGATLHTGLRADFPESGPDRFTPRAGLTVPLGQSGFTLAANYARGFKQPSFFALGFPLIANPDLLPETSTTYDGGISWASADGNWTASAVAYRSVYRDLIDFDPDRFTNINRTRVTAKGFELAASGQWNRLRLLGNLTYLSSRSADEAPLRFRPEWKGTASLEWAPHERVTVRIDGRFNGEFLDSSVATGFQTIDGFTTLDAQVSVVLRPGLELRAALRNLTGKSHYRTIGTPEPGRNTFISLHGSL